MIIQFGTSRFLQAHVDLFASEARDSGQHVPPIVVVQTTHDASRAARLSPFGRDEGFPILVGGCDTGGNVIDRTTIVHSVVSGLSAHRDRGALTSLFDAQAQWIVSNTGDLGFEVDPADRTPAILAGGAAPLSFPAILLSLLYGRWRATGQPVTLLPCELVVRNGAALKEAILSLARAIGADPPFVVWLERECLWIDTLVDRIVSQAIEPLGAVAEPYALWAVERQPRLVMPFSHPAIVLTDDLEVHERLKLHILNLGHSWLAQRWLDRGAPSGMTVRDSMRERATYEALRQLYRDEVVAGFAHRGMSNQAAAYVETTMVRFANPFLDHQLSDIAEHHGIKVNKRIRGFISWVNSAAGGPPCLPILAALARPY